MVREGIGGGAARKAAVAEQLKSKQREGGAAGALKPPMT